MKKYGVPVLIYFDAEDKEEAIRAVNDFLMWQFIGTNFDFEYATDSEVISDYEGDQEYDE